MGREAELVLVEAMLARATHARPFRSILLTGVRGVGKTVLLNRFDALASDAGWATSFYEIAGDRKSVRPFRDVMAEMCRRTILSLDRMRRLGDRGRRIRGVLAAFLRRSRRARRAT